MTGIAVQTSDWISENEYLEVSTLERLAEVVDCDTREIALPDYHDNENVIEWLRGGKTATLSLTQGRTITRIMKLAKSRLEECRIIAENVDGSIVARVPVGWIKISPIREVSEEQKEAARVRMKEMRENEV